MSLVRITLAKPILRHGVDPPLLIDFEREVTVKSHQVHTITSTTTAVPRETVPVPAAGSGCVVPEPVAGDASATSAAGSGVVRPAPPAPAAGGAPPAP